MDSAGRFWQANAPPRPGDAIQLTAPVLFHVQWDDELFPRDGQFALFDLLGSAEKQLIAYPGAHGETRPGAIEMWREFISSHLPPQGPSRLP